MITTITPELEAAQAELDTFGNEVFPEYHSATQDHPFDLYTTVTREFDVAELMTGLGIAVAPEYEFQPSPFVESTTRQDYEAAAAISSSGWDGDSREPSDYPEVVARFGENAVERGLCILLDSSAVTDLLYDYFRLEQLSDTAPAQLARYMELLDKADRAYRDAGWSL